MKNSFLIFVSIAIISCHPGVQKVYSEASLNDDLKVISRYISKEQLQLLKEYIANSKSLNLSFDSKTYSELLIEAEEAEEAENIRLYELNIKDGETISFNIKKPMASNANNDANITHEEVITLTGTVKDKAVEVVWAVELPQENTNTQNNS